MNLFQKMLQIVGRAIFLSAMILGMQGCGKSDAQSGPSQVAVSVNRLRLTLQDLQEEIQSGRLTPDPKDTAPEPQWLSALIDEEILIQEAQKQGVDREKDFMKTIERFWKQALIKTLISRKEKEISTQVHVYEPETEAYYRKMAEAQNGEPIQPLSAIRKDIEREVRNQKETAAMEEWFAHLKRQSQIAVNREVVKSLQ